MEIGILIPSILTILILLFAIYQQRTFRRTEQHLQDRLSKKDRETEFLQQTFRHTEQHLQDRLSEKDKETEFLQQTFRHTEKQLTNQLLKYLQE